MASYTKHDLEFILAQIKISEADAATPAADLIDLVGHPNLPYGVRTVTGEYNNLYPGQEGFGASDNTLPRLLDPVFNPAENQTSYAQPNGNVFDSQPRIISNLIADQTISNPAAVAAAIRRAGSVNVSADTQNVLAANAQMKSAAASVTAAQALADTTLATLNALQSSNNSNLNTATANNSAAQAALVLAQAELTAAQNAANDAANELSSAETALANANDALLTSNQAVTAAQALANNTQTIAESNAAAAASALTTYNEAVTAAAAAVATQSAAQNNYNTAIQTANSAAPSDPAVVAAKGALDAATDDKAAKQALLATAQADLGVASGTAATANQAAADAVVARAAALLARDNAQIASDEAAATLVTEGSEQAIATANQTTALSLRSSALTAFSNANIAAISAQLALDVAILDFGSVSPEADAARSILVTANATLATAEENFFIANSNLASANSALTIANSEFAAAQSAATSALNTLSSTNSALTLANDLVTTTATTASSANDAAAAAQAAVDLAQTAVNDATALEATELLVFEAAISTFVAGDSNVAAALAALNTAISNSNAAAAAETAAFNAFNDANSAAATSAEAAANAATALATAQADQASTQALVTQLQGLVNTETTENQAAQTTLAAEQTEFALAEGAASAAQASLELAQAAASVNNSELQAAFAANNAANDGLTLAQEIATSSTNNFNELIVNLGLEISSNGSILVANLAPDEGLSAPYNSWFTLFGQFFDHGLDSITKGGNGTVFIPLKPDDPLYVEGSFTNFMVVTRATLTNGQQEATNVTTPFVDQNQTYSSHPSHQVFLRAYELVEGVPKATGELVVNRDLGLDGKFGTSDDTVLGGMATWEVVKAQARDILGINLSDADVTGGPLLATDDYGNFLPGPNGFVQLVTSTGLVEGNINSPISTANAIKGGYAFLDDIAHTAAPRGSNGVLKTADNDDAVGLTPTPGTAVYDNELLDAHYIAGDGRANENIGLTAVHDVFHSEHNRLVQHTKDVVLESGDLTFINEWLVGTPLTTLPTASEIATLKWDGERLFQAAKFGTEMQYQHLVFEEFARKFQPQVDVFAGYDGTINPAITAEFAHVVYRFGHSMLNETVDRYDASFGLVNGDTEQVGLIEAFLNPLEFVASGVTHEEATGAIVRGMTRQAGNEIDEFVTEALRNNLVGLPLDLAAINIARGRETGVPSLNAARRDFFTNTSDSQLKPYESWVDFANNVRNPESVINFIAAYGTHSALRASDVDTMADKRAIATALVIGGNAVVNEGTSSARIFIANDDDRTDFLNSAGIYANSASGVTTTGVDAIDFWMGGLAEKQMPFGGLLGSTFNFVFETQMEQLQDGDRFYYLARTAGLNFLSELEANSFASLIMRNSDVTRLPGDVFSTPDFILEVDQSKQFTGLGATGRDDPTEGGTIFSPLVVRNNPSTSGPDTNYLKFNGGEHVVLGGTEGNDILISSIGDDTIWGDGGDDRIEGGDGVDILNGGAGNDIITDKGGDDNIKGGDGDDVINGGNGFDLIIAGSGSDFVVAGEDPKEVFGNQGNDFILGSSTFDTVFGDQGDDWIDGGGSADLLQGDMGDPFQEGTIFGNDVLIGGGGNDDYDAESGDDIMVMGSGTQRAEGMLGFDWAIHKNQATAADADLNFTGLLPPTVDNLKDRFDLVEGLSGWNQNDTLRGDDFGAAQLLTEAVAGNVLTNHAINSTQQIDLIDGLQEFLDGMLGAGQTSFAAGNIIMGGSGSDLIEGRGGNDLIDGDTWLNVRIAVSGHDTITSAEKMSDIAPYLFSGEIKPSQLSIKREILDTSASTDIDTALFSGNRADYTVTQNAGGTITVAHTNVLAGVADDGVDTLRNIEFIQFADQTVSTVAPVITSNGGGDNAAFAVDENTNSILTTVSAGLGVTFALGGVDAARFNINASTGALSFIQAPNFEAPTDADGNNIYDIVVVANGGLLSDSQALSINVNNIVEAPTITSNGGGDTASVSVAENTTFATTFTVNSDIFPVIYSLSGGDADKFSINATTGVLSFISAPNFESPADAGGDNIYNVVVRASDGSISAEFDEQALAVTIINADEAGTGSLKLGYNLNANSLGNTTSASLTTSSTVVDPDGMSIVRYQWQSLNGANWVNIGAATTAPTILTNQINNTVRSVLTYTDASFGQKTIISNETAIISANNAANTGVGTAGDDILLGLGGSDSLTGNAGNDVVDGGSGNDRVIATINDGNDIYIGGTGTDTYDLSGTAAAALVSLTTSTASSAQTGLDTLNSFENVIGSTGNDTITDAAGINAINGGNGNDTFIMTNDNARDVIRGDAGIDTVDYSLFTNALTVLVDGDFDVVGSGTGGNTDRIRQIENFIGGLGADNITGNGNVNTLVGGGGNDIITGGQGADILTGGQGADTFVYNNINESLNGVTERDVIRDFLSGIDKINLSGIDANTTVAGNQAFSFIGTNAFSDSTLGATLAAGQVRFIATDTDGDLINDSIRVLANINNNLQPDFEILLQGVNSINATDIIL